MVIILALFASLAYAVASICQRLGVEDAPPAQGPSVGLVRHMLGRRIWLLGFMLMGLAYAAQSVALHLGSLNVVQPLMVSELVLLVILLRLWYATPLRVLDGLAALATAGGLGAFLAVASPSPGDRSPSSAQWIAVGSVVVLVAVLFVAVARRGPSWWRALSMGLAASTGFALLAAITKSATDVLLTGWATFFSSWPIYALCVVGLSSFLLMQSAFQAGPFAASQSALILWNPLVSLAIGRILFDEKARGGALNLVVESGSLGLMILGAVMLSTSPLVAGVHEETPDAHLLRGRGRYARWRQARSADHEDSRGT